jgi:hypothetical protein
MRKRYVGLLWSGLSSAALVATAGALAMTHLRWIGGPMLLPGLLAAAVIFPEGIQSDHPYLYLAFSVVLDFFSWWFTLFALSEIFTRALQRRRASNALQ